MIIRLFILLICNLIFFSTSVAAQAPLKAVFIRDHQLWLKEEDKEERLSNSRYVYSPKWSYDGRFIAYLIGDRNGEKTTLYIYDVEKKQSYQPYIGVETSHFEWSPVANQLAYTSDGVLNVTKLKNEQPSGFENVALGVSDFAWFPQGNELIVSSGANLLPTGWDAIHLYKISADANLNQKKIKPFYTIKAQSADFFAIDANDFKWSRDGQWVSFLATPTASASNDSNILCVLSASGHHFQVIGNMLWNPNWIKWSPYENKLAYISGEGRFLVQNKITTVADIPILAHQKKFTPQGFVDIDLEWLSDYEMIVARAKENTEWKEGPVPKQYSKLFLINLKTMEQKQLTFPKKSEIDKSPQVIGKYITWYRKGSKGDVWFKKGVNGKPKLWIKNADEAPIFYKNEF